MESRLLRTEHLGVLRRDDPHGMVRWFLIEPCFVMHTLNAYDDGARGSCCTSSGTPT
jgi:carotenoid cleavage dioxygenase-like enzyme